MLETVSAVIANYNGEEHLHDCILSLKKQTHSLSEIIVIDNGSKDRSREICDKHGVIFHGLSKNCGLSVAYNTGAELTAGEYILLTNNDIKLDTMALSALLEVIKTDNEIFSVDPMQISWNGEEIVHALTTFKKTGFFSNFVPGLTSNSKTMVPEPFSTPWSSTGCMLVRRNVFLKIEGFDSSFFFDFGDVDIGIRAWLAGYRNIFVPTAKIWHKVKATASKKEIKPILEISTKADILKLVFRLMPLHIIAKTFIAQFIRMFSNLIRLRLYIFFAYIMGFFDFLKNLPDLINQRRFILKNAKISMADLLKQFIQ